MSSPGVPARGAGPGSGQACRQLLGVDDGQRLGALARDRSRSATRLADDHGQVGLGVLHLIEHLVVPVVGIDRHDAGAERVERQVVEEELGAVLEQQGHAMAVAVAGRWRRRSYSASTRAARLAVRELDAVGMIGPARGRRRAQEDVVGRRLRPWP